MSSGMKVQNCAKRAQLRPIKGLYFVSLTFIRLLSINMQTTCLNLIIKLGWLIFNAHINLIIGDYLDLIQIKPKPINQNLIRHDFSHTGSWLNL